MPFVKLDTGILESTLWTDRGMRDVFITALLMAEPCQLKDPAEQIEVDSLEKTGFIIPPGWYGFIAAAGVGIIRRALVSDAEGMKALKELGAPDLQSRSPEYEGRRLVRISGGFILLNYVKYRDKDHGAAERMRAFRQRKKSEVVTGEPSLLQRTVTYADADADKNPSGNLLVLTPKPEPQRSLSEQMRSLIFDYYRKHNKHPETGQPIDPPWTGAEGNQLSMLQKAMPSMDIVLFTRCLVNRHRSDGVNHAERPCIWLPSIVKYLTGPLDSFGKPKPAPKENTFR